MKTPSPSTESTSRTDNLGRTYRDIKRDYVFDGSPFCEDEEKVRRAQWVVENKLSAADRTIIILYAEIGSYRKLGKRLGLSHTTVKNEVHRIRKIIIENL